MTTEASQFMAEALKRVKLDGDFAPEDVGKYIGMNKDQSEMAARLLSNAGVLVLGFDNSAHFSPEFQKMTEQNAPKPPRKKPGRRREVQSIS